MTTSLIRQKFPSFEAPLIEELESSGEIRSFKAGEQLLRTGQYFKSTMLILDGLVKVYREDEQGSEFLMYYLAPGQACALSMICGIRQEASAIMAIAVKDTDVVAVPLTYMDAWVRKYPSWYQFVVDTYRSRFEEMLITIDHIAFRAMDERLEFYLKRHADIVGSNIVSLSHQQIADELNSSREVISRLLKKMEQLGKVRLQRNAIELIHWK
ncbi:MAG TPA: Crp/Fnr family transcriptional regulator [Flavihumibacter sp.]|jgi:CRP/FNR family transcriptional regulator